MPTVGESIKVWLPGETPWADCLVVHPDGSWTGQLKNDMYCTADHGLRFDDIVRFVPCPNAPNMPWTLAHLANDSSFTRRHRKANEVFEAFGAHYGKMDELAKCRISDASAAMSDAMATMKLLRVVLEKVFD